MSTIITRPAFEGPHPLATTAPSPLVINEAQRQFDMAQQRVQDYVNDKSKGHAFTIRIDRGIVTLFRNMHDRSGQCRYGDWEHLDGLIQSTLDYIAAVQSRGAPDLLAMAKRDWDRS